MKNTEIKSIIEQAQACFGTVTREKTGKEIIVLNDTNEQYNKLSTALFEVVKTPVDSVYEYAAQIISGLEDLIDDDYLADETPDEDIEQVLFDSLLDNNYLEAEIYTSDLTAWLAESNYHIEYLDQALEEFGSKDGIQALQIANSVYKEEIARSLIHELFTK